MELECSVSPTDSSDSTGRLVEWSSLSTYLISTSWYATAVLGSERKRKISTLSTVSEDHGKFYQAEDCYEIGGYASSAKQEGLRS